MFVVPVVFKPVDVYDKNFLASREGDWTHRGFILPSGLSFPDPMPGMVWAVYEGSLMMLKAAEC